MVSFELTDEQREIRDWVHAFAEKEIRPVAAQYDESEEFPWPVVKKAAEVGLYGVDFLQQIYGDSTGIMPALVSEELPPSSRRGRRSRSRPGSRPVTAPQTSPRSARSPLPSPKPAPTCPR